MKIKVVILWIIVLVVTEQVIKLIISTNYQDLNIEIIPSLLEFKPTLNNKTFYWLGLMNIDVGRWVRLATSIIVLSILCLSYFYMKTISMKEKLIDAVFVFGFAGVLSSLCDNIFFGGSWDYVYLKPLFIFDLKDLYLDCFAILSVVFGYKNHATTNNIKIKDIIYFAKNRLNRN
jgi:lipoprotein signal peptidase